MKLRVKLFYLISILSLSMLLLIGFSYAWFTKKNSTVNAGETLGQVVDQTKCVDSIKYYKGVSIENNNGNRTLTLQEANSNINLGSYDILKDDAPQVLLEIDLLQNCKIDLVSNATSYLGETKTNDDGTISVVNKLQKEGNSLSSIISFMVIDESNITFENNNVKSINYTKSNDLSFVKINSNNLTKDILLSNNYTNDKLYLLLDYYEESIDYIYTLNIGNTALDPTSETNLEHENDISYTCDFKLLFKEV
jgi:hypothetical protein